MKTSELIQAIIGQRHMLVCEYREHKIEKTQATEKQRTAIPFLDIAVIHGAEAISCQVWPERGQGAESLPKIPENIKRGDLLVIEVSDGPTKTKWGVRCRCKGFYLLDK
jgi:hypothetical protein